jgi:hypothetical protein
MKANLTVNITQGYLSQIPIKTITRKDQQVFVRMADQIIHCYEDFYKWRSLFLNRMAGTYGTGKSQKLGAFYGLTFQELLNEIYSVSPNRLSLNSQDELEQYFNEYRQKLQSARSKIAELESRIDDLVFDLYGLDTNQRKLVELEQRPRKSN